MEQAELFDSPEPTERKQLADFFLANKNGRTAHNGVEAQLAILFELSVDAWYAAIHARMSELPIGKEISRFIEKAAGTSDRAAAAQSAFDRGDPDVLCVHKAAYKVTREIHRITGFLRFSPDADGIYIARCEPDYFILPALADHFYQRFGDTPWAIIDEKRGLCLYREKNGEVRLSAVQDVAFLASCDSPAGKAAGDEWEDLWRLYHRSVNNEGRSNPALQRQFMPERYQKYLCELKKY